MPTAADSEFLSFVHSTLAPMFPGTKFNRSSFSPANLMSRVCSYVNPTTLRIRSDARSSAFYEMIRSQPFDGIERVFVQRVIESFASVQHEARSLAKLLEDYAVRSAVAKTLTHEPGLVAHRERQFQTVSQVLEIYTQWASTTYEGDNVSAGVVVSPCSGGGTSETLNYSKLASDDFFKVVSDGVRSWWSVDDRGFLESLVPISECRDEDTLFTGRRFYPEIYRPIAEFSIGGKIAAVLNRNGEILVFQGHLKFAKRRGTWLYFGHDAIVRQLSHGSGPSSFSVRKAIYDSCLDASFARSGACIGVIRRDRMRAFTRANLVERADFFPTSTSLKTLMAKKLIADRKFQELPRLIRKELLALDGALVLDHNGEVLAAGAIVELQGVGRSNQGGRSAAAKALSRFGLGIKVSEDGMISGFKFETGADQPCFRIG
jgi:hypothetical protein